METSEALPRGGVRAEDLAAIVEKPGPFLTLYLDTRPDIENAGPMIEQRWRTLRGGLIDRSVAQHTCAALLIAQGAHPKAIQAHLGHSSIQVTLDLYGHLYPDEMDRLADRLDAAHDANPPQVAASVRHGKETEILEFPPTGRKRASDQGVSEWGGEDSNLRPTDYESAALTN